VRELKFRAWDNVDNRMIYAGENIDICFTLGSAGIECVDLNKISPSGDGVDSMEHLKYMQFTGLKDKNGKGIYEGDIVEGINRLNEDWKIPQKVTFLKGCYMFGNWNAHEYFNRHQAITVIGNIYENPELLQNN
jgi:uncharacterized phage protein (TIGR01671 family)